MLYSAVDVFGIIANASNIRTGGDNPEYTKEKFLESYPQFTKTDDDGNPVIPDVVIEGWLKLANAALSYARYREYWEMCMGLFIAHWLTLYLQGKANPEDSVQKIVNSGLAKGLQTSKSAAGLSVSYDFSVISGSDFSGWGTYKYTLYGQQFITIAKMLSIGGMTVW